MPDVSVIIPLYGRHRGQSILRTVTEAWLAQDRACEVTVAIAGDLAVEVAEDVDADRVVRILRVDASVGVRGRLQNLAAANARAPFLYVSDADIVPLGPDFLDRALCLADRQAFVQPWMYRLVDDGGGVEPTRFHAPAPGQFCFVTAAVDGSLDPCGGEELMYKRADNGGTVVEMPMFRRLPRTSATATTDSEWLMPFHCGGLLLHRQVFFDLGGYCPGYVGWGGEDEDLLVKIGGCYRSTRGWQLDSAPRCLHFEHPRPYLDTPERAANFALYVERINAGAVAMVDEDLAAVTPWDRSSR